jgi:uncharacterized protein (DUF58 family)
LTREGWLWLCLIVFLWLIGMFKGINLLSLLAALMLACLVVNWVSAKRRLRWLRLRRWVDEPLFAHTPAGVAIEIENPEAKAAVGIRIQDQGTGHHIAWFLHALPGGTRARLSGEVSLPRRGIYEWQPPQAVCSAPFGLVEARIRSETPEQTTVFPQLGRLYRNRLRRFWTHAAMSMALGRRHKPSPHPDAQNELHGVRAFRSGDSPRWIHWPTSARRGELMTREFEDVPTDNLIIVLDPWISHRRPDTPFPKANGNPALEAALSLTATICWEWCRQAGNNLVLAVAGEKPEVLAGLTSHALALSLLDRLAKEEGNPAPDAEALCERLLSTPLPPATIVLISTRFDSFNDSLEVWFHRPVAFIDASRDMDYDFYERPTRAS